MVILRSDFLVWDRWLGNFGRGSLTWGATFECGSMGAPGSCQPLANHDPATNTTRTTKHHHHYVSFAGNLSWYLIRAIRNH